jgi:hypothetical protein
MNGRKLLEIREIKCQLGIMKNTSGSALFEIGNTKVVAFLQGPHEVRDLPMIVLIAFICRLQTEEHRHWVLLQATKGYLMLTSLLLISAQ